MLSAGVLSIRECGLRKCASVRHKNRSMRAHTQRLIQAQRRALNALCAGTHVYFMRTIQSIIQCAQLCSSNVSHRPLEYHYHCISMLPGRLGMSAGSNLTECDLTARAIWENGYWKMHTRVIQTHGRSTGEFRNAVKRNSTARP